MTDADQPDGGQAELEPSDQDRIQHREDAHIGVDCEMAEHQGQQLSAAKKVPHQGGKVSALDAAIIACGG